MNLLYSKLPDYVEVSGVEYKINVRYTYILKIFEIIEDNEQSDEEKTIGILSLFYKEKIPDDIEAAINAVFEFIGAGSYQTNYRGKGSGKALFLYTRDHQLIWASMAQTYGLDWKHHQLHWWEFKAAFDNLPEDTPIKSVIRIRGKKIKAKMSSEEKQDLLDAKQMYSLDGNIEKQQTAAEIEKELLEGIK